MSDKKMRNLFSIHNKYQMQIVMLEVVPLLLVAICLTVIVFVMGDQVDRLLSSQSYGMVASCIAQWFYYTVCFVFFLLVIFLVGSFKFSQNLVNPFSRILKELDEIILTGAKKELTVRPEDELANDVISRINELMKRLK